MASEILLATRSRDKAEEIMQILGSGSVRVVTLADLAIPPMPDEDDIENYPTFVDNAVAKARHFAQRTGRATLADDSGLMVDAFEGAPGVRTKRFAADHGIRAAKPDEANNDLLLERLREVPDERRTAQYVCAAALVTADGHVLSAIGTCHGQITRARIGSGGFGYDPLFLLPDLGVTFAQLTSAEKNQRSHRARAFRAIASHLKQAAGR